jgi:hypothetical protein
MQVVAEGRGGVCLSTEYVNNKNHLRWRCEEGHEWDAIPNDVKRGSWCPECARVARMLPLDVRRQSLQKVQALARERGGECLSTAYVNNHTKLLWRCRKNHEWDATSHDVKQGTWCPACAGRPRVTIEQMQTLAIERGGKCLSTAYVNKKTKLRWQCAIGHEWETSPDTVKQGCWCPECARAGRP